MKISSSREAIAQVPQRPSLVRLLLRRVAQQRLGICWSPLAQIENAEIELSLVQIRLERQRLFIVFGSFVVLVQRTLGKRQIEKCRVVFGIRSSQFSENLLRAMVIVLIQRLQAFRLRIR